MKNNKDIAKSLDLDLEKVASYLDSRDIPRMFDTLVSAGRRISEIVNNMLSFSRISDDRREPVFMGELIDKTLELAASDFDMRKKYDFKSISIRKNYGRKSTFCLL